MNFLTLFIGPNCIGKTTFGNSLLPKGITHVNLDELVLNKIDEFCISNLKSDPNNIDFQANFIDKFENLLFETSVEYYNYCIELIKNNKNISLEGNVIPEKYSDTRSIIKYAQNKNYSINLVFFATRDIEFVKKRVEVRTQITGQYVSNKLIETNFKGGFDSLENILSDKFNDFVFENILVFELKINQEENASYYKVLEISNNVVKAINIDFVNEYIDLIPSLKNCLQKHNTHN